MTFTEDQQKALEFLTKFVRSNDKIATLYGAAGTGKTFILNYFVHQICNFPVCVTAPTHKAVRVIEKAVNKKGQTFHSLHGLRPNVDLLSFNIDNVQFDPLSEPKIKNYKLVIVDECSQVNRSLQRLNEDRANTFNTKILYVGDNLQLPPIGENISYTFKIPNTYRLTHIVRQEKGNPVLELLAILRHDAEHTTSLFEKYINKHPKKLTKGIGYETLETNPFVNKAIILFGDEDSSRDATKILAFTNKTIDRFNEGIRNKVHDITDIIIKDDLILSHTTLFDEFNEPVLLNSADYAVESVRKRTTDFDIDVYEIFLIDTYNNSLTPPLWVVDYNSNTYGVFIDLISKFQSIATHSYGLNRRKAWKEYFKFKQQYLLMRDVTLHDGKVLKKDISYGYAMSIHKAQGSTYQNVLVDLKDIMFRNRDTTKPIINTRNMPDAVDMRNKLLYTAVSRAAKQVIMLK